MNLAKAAFIAKKRQLRRLVVRDEPAKTHVVCGGGGGGGGSCCYIAATLGIWARIGGIGTPPADWDGDSDFCGGCGCWADGSVDSMSTSMGDREAGAAMELQEW
ncbi:hypothetical protein ColKHC_02734 [Colletotrichum higginsianum]|nr:hypothetical protein ColKHC_02734 [Colletotrichum higginsianum]